MGGDDVCDGERGDGGVKRENTANTYTAPPPSRNQYCRTMSPPPPTRNNAGDLPLALSVSASYVHFDAVVDC